MATSSNSVIFRHALIAHVVIASAVWLSAAASNLPVSKAPALLSERLLVLGLAAYIALLFAWRTAADSLIAVGWGLAAAAAVQYTYFLFSTDLLKPGLVVEPFALFPGQIVQHSQQLQWSTEQFLLGQSLPAFAALVVVLVCSLSGRGKLSVVTITVLVLVLGVILGSGVAWVAQSRTILKILPVVVALLNGAGLVLLIVLRKKGRLMLGPAWPGLLLFAAYSSLGNLGWATVNSILGPEINWELSRESLLILDIAALGLIPWAMVKNGLALSNGSSPGESVEAARRDALTGLFNRRLLDQMGPKLFTDSHQMDRPVSLLLLDIDHFKHVNDLYGHPAGDEVLRKFAQVVEAQVRATDLVARYGGEEFAVVLPGAPLAAALRLGERVRGATEHSEFEIPGGEKLRISVSVGVATAFPEEISSFKDLTQQADTNLYRAKRAGRNRVMSNPLDEEGEE